MNAEMATIVLESLTAYPWEQIKGAVIATGRQLVMVNTGYGVNTDVWHTYGMIETYAPQMMTAMSAAHQQQHDLNFTAMNRVHVPAAYLAMLLLLGMITLRHERIFHLQRLACTVALALMANAFVCGALSLVLGAMLLVTMNYAVSGKVAWTPGGIALMFGRMLNEGIAQRYLTRQYVHLTGLAER